MRRGVEKRERVSRTLTSLMDKKPIGKAAQMSKRLSHRPEVAEEYCQDILIKLLSAKKSRDIYQVGLDVVRDDVGRKGTDRYQFNQNLGFAENDPEFFEREFTPDTRDVLLREKLERALMTLTPNQRNVVVLYGVEEMTKSEIAHKLKCSQQWVGMNLRRAFEKLRRELAGEK